MAKILCVYSDGIMVDPYNGLLPSVDIAQLMEMSFPATGFFSEYGVRSGQTYHEILCAFRAIPYQDVPGIANTKLRDVFNEDVDLDVQQAWSFAVSSVFCVNCERHIAAPFYFFGLKKFIHPEILPKLETGRLCTHQTIRSRDCPYCARMQYEYVTCTEEWQKFLQEPENPCHCYACGG